MRKMILRAMVLLALITAGVAVTATPALADPAACTNYDSWHVASGGWGQWRQCSAVDAAGNGNRWFRVQIDDTATDGYAVHFEVYDVIQSNVWNEVWGPGACIGCLNSSGPVATSNWFAFYTLPSDDHVSVRLVKGRSSVPGPMQQIAFSTSILPA